MIASIQKGMRIKDTERSVIYEHMTNHTWKWDKKEFGDETKKRPSI